MEKSAANRKETIDPVCGMMVDQSKTDLVTIFEGKSYYFCAEGCRKTFSDKPQKYLKPKKKGWLGRYMDKMAKANQDAFGNSGPKCH